MENASEIINDLNKKFQIYSGKFSQQFHLQIPKKNYREVRNAALSGSARCKSNRLPGHSHLKWSEFEEKN